MNVSRSDQQGDIGVYAVGLKVTQELGWIFRSQPLRDIGIDAQVEVIDNNKSKAELLALQIKSGKSWFGETNEQGIIFRGDPNHLEYWQKYPLSVIVVLYDDRNKTAYWQVVSAETVINTGKGWKMIIPFSQKLDNSSQSSLKAICRSIVNSEKFSLLSLKDVSHGGAKRYSANLLIQGQLSKADIINIVKQVTRDLTNREYYRSDLVKDLWENTQAQVVWLFLYLGLEDVKQANYICRSQWIDQKLEPPFRPVGLDGIDIGECIIFDWSNQYEELANFYRKNTRTKEDFLTKSIFLLEEIKKLVKEITQLRASYDSGKTNRNLFLDKMTNYEVKCTTLYEQSADIGVPPLECEDFASKLSCVMSYAHNIVIPFSENGLKTWSESNRHDLMKQAIKDYEHDLIRLNYELEKLI